MAKLHEELKKIREDRGITKKQIVEKIKIRADFLERLENGDLTFVPMPFVRGFIREYAKVIGIEPDLAIQRLDNKISTLLAEEKEPVTKEEHSTSAQFEIPKSQDTPADEKGSEKPETENAAQTEMETEDEVKETPGPQTSLFEEPVKKTEHETKEQIQEKTAPEKQTEISGESIKVSGNEAEEKTTTSDKNSPPKDNISVISSDASPVSIPKTIDTADFQEQDVQSEEVEKRVPLEIKNGESPSNVAFFIFIAVLILLAVIILLMNRGSLF